VNSKAVKWASKNVDDATRELSTDPNIVDIVSSVNSHHNQREIGLWRIFNGCLE
jgi:hypothetical protein